MEFNPFYTVDCCEDHSDILNHLSDFLSGHDFHSYKNITIDLGSIDTIIVRGYRTDGTIEKISIHGKSFHVMECKKRYVR